MKSEKTKTLQQPVPFKLSTIAITVSIVFSTFGLNAKAQGQEQSEEETIELISVTGSRLKSREASSSQPLNSISEKDFDVSGALTVADAINELPQIGESFGATNQDINSLNNGFGVGIETVNLRNLGAQRTLVLVNGRRHVGGDPGTSSVDMNSIPAAMISNIEVITGAASAVYGADAVSGVVNVILKDNFEGTAIDFRTGVSSEGDAEEYAGSFTHGGILGDEGKGQYLLSLEYTIQQPILGADRPFAQFDGNSVTGLSEESAGSGVNPGGLFASDGSFFPSGTGGFGPDGTFIQPFAERFQRVRDRFLQNETERFVFSGKTEYDITDDSTFFAEITLANSEVDVQFEPQLAVFSTAGFDGSGTAGFRFPTAATNSDNGLRTITRRFSEFGPRKTTIERDMVRLATGVDGYIGDHNYQIYYQYGQVESTQTDFDTIDKLRMVTAIDPVACSQTDDCIFADIYGRGTLDPAALSFVARDLNSDSESKQHVISAFVSGDLIDFADMQYVVGAEYRKEEVKIQPNSLLIAVPNTFTGGDPASLPFVGTQGTRTFGGNTEGEYDVSEVFGELLLPLGDDANLKAAARFSDYSSVGTEFTWGLTADWSVTDSVVLRASFGSATRAPNINELFAPAVSVTGSVIDLCEGASGQVATNCSQLISSYDPAIFEQTDFQENVRVFQNGGNQELDSELANTITLGAVITPSDNLTVSVDYYSIQMEDVLSTAFSARATADRCTLTLDPQFCDLVTRDSAGIIQSVITQQVNLAEEGVKGIDVTLSYGWSLGDGEMTLRTQYSHLFEHTRQVNDESVEEDLVGRVDNIENKLNTTLSYSNEKWELAAIARYLDSAVQTVDPILAENALGNEIGSQVYIDMQASYLLSDDFTLGFGVKNLTDREAPVVTDLYENNGSGTTTAGGIYDVRGQYFYLFGSYTF
tara:strand:- start:2938 stop:5727 length:2790 start_codon:yes stop_codon:yes gene_type:complete